MQPGFRERLASAGGAVCVVGLLGYLLIVSGQIEFGRRADPPTTLLDLTPPPRDPIKRVILPPRSMAAKHRAAPANVRNKASDIVVPPPIVVLPPPSPVIAATKPNSGTAASSGASDRAGPGTGAGGQGNGLGGGGDGGDGDTPPRLIKGRLRFSDLSAELKADGVGGTVSVRYEIAVDGHIGECVVTASSGSAELDRQTCQLIRTHFRYKPSRDHTGRAVPSMIEEDHSWIVDRSIDAPSG